MKKLIALSIVLFSITVVFQSEDIEIIAERETNVVTFFAKNNTNAAQQITLTLKQLEGLEGYTEPIKKDVSAGAKIQFARLTSKEGSYMYGTSYTYEPADLAKLRALTIERLKKEKKLEKALLFLTSQAALDVVLPQTTLQKII